MKPNLFGCSLAALAMTTVAYALHPNAVQAKPFVRSNSVETAGTFQKDARKTEQNQAAEAASASRRTSRDTATRPARAVQN